MKITDIDMHEIFSDPTFNCRGEAIAPIDVQDLANDIRKHGLQQPIVVQPYDHRHRIVAGHRRHAAIKVLKWETIPCIVNPNLTEAEALILNLGENIHRKDLNILQESNALLRLKLAGMSVIEVAEDLNKSTTWVQVRYLLLELPEDIQKAAAAGFINQSQVRQIHKLPDIEKQIEAARKIKDAKVRGEKAPRIKTSGKRNIVKAKIRDSDDIFWMMDHLQEHIGNNLATRTLAWANGEISDLELFEDLQRAMESEGKSYVVPYALGETV